MKRTLIFIVLIVAFLTEGQAQFDVDLNRYAWERTSYERWDRWRPWLYFNIFNRRYKREDRRTMYTRARQMSQWAIYADEYELYRRQVDSVFRNETHKALDRTLNKNWLLFQRPRALKLYEKIEEQVNLAIDYGIPDVLYLAFEEQYTLLQTNIEFCKDSYVPDADKYPLIEKEIKKLETLLATLTGMNDLRYFLTDQPEAILENFDFTQPIELQINEIDELIIPE